MYSSSRIKFTALLVFAFIIQSLLIAQPRLPHLEPRGHVETERPQENRERNETRIQGEARIGNLEVTGRFERPVRVELEKLGDKTVLQLKQEYPDRKVIIESREKGEKYSFDPSRNEITIADNVVIPAKDDYRIEDINRFAAHEYKKSSVFITSIVDELSDKPMVSKLKKAAKDNRIEYSLLDKKHIDAIFKKAENGVLIISSHYQDNKLYARTSDNKEIYDKSFSQDELNAAAKKNNVTLVFLGCETKEIGNGAGLEKEVRDNEVAAGLINLMHRLRSNETISRTELFKSILPENNKMIVSTLDITNDASPVTIEISRIPKLSSTTTSNSVDSVTAASGEGTTAPPSKGDSQTPYLIAIVVGVSGFLLYKSHKQKSKTV
jgi:hypothetical protein